MSNAAPGADDDARCKILRQEFKAERAVKVSILSIYWTAEWAATHGAERVFGKLVGVLGPTAQYRYKFLWSGDGAQEVIAAGDIVKADWDFQIEDGEDGAPAATLLEPEAPAPARGRVHGGGGGSGFGFGFGGRFNGRGR